MSQATKRIVRNTVAYLMTIFFIVALVVEFSSGQTQQARSDDNPLIKLGQFPPDFELPKLNFKTDETGKTVGVISNQDMVRLSSFRGKKPVCLIMSSYT